MRLLGHAGFLEIVLLMTCVRISLAGSPFAARVVDYSPAPGQFVNTSAYNNPNVALNEPNGWGVVDGTEESIVTLGGFGGSITLAFDHMVEDDPLNPFGMDAIVFGNSFWIGDGPLTVDPNRHWAECATIEISLDVNGNGLADDPWYLIPGSHITDPVGQLVEQTWDSNTADDEYPPAYDSWIPSGYSGTWTTRGYLLPPAIFAQLVVENPDSEEGREGIQGYADFAPTLILGDLDADDVVDDPLITAEEFYTVPDDPFALDITPGSGGGDAFDIAWAIDPLTGSAADLPGFDFIRLTNGVDSIQGPFGEISPEIDAVADVAVDPFGDHDDDGDVDLMDIAGFQNCYAATTTVGMPCERADRQADDTVDLADLAALVSRLTGPLR